MKKLTIKLKDYGLDKTGLDLLMSEFYGRELASTAQDDDIIEYGFGFSEDSEGFDPKELFESAEKALFCFKLKQK